MKNKYIVLIVISLILTSCENNTKPKTIVRIDTVYIENNDTLFEDNVSYDSIINEKAKLIAAKNPSFFELIQDKIFYKNHKKTTERNWNNLDLKHLKPIQTWATENIDSLTKNASTLFYPFSGPDILYALTLFPNCENYILFGLENPGTIPNFETANDSLLKPYFNNLSHSIKNLNKFGYFVTLKMKYDFRNNLLDGVLHVILFHLALTNHIVLDVEPFYLDNYGNLVVIEQLSDLSKKIEGIKINFKSENSQDVKTIFYLQNDVSDINMIDKMEFSYFISNFDKKITFIKSASYLLFHENFNMIKNIIINQSSIILQDDTGIPYNEFSKYDFTTRLYGNYNKTIRIFSEKFQPDLKSAIEKENRQKTLPFRFGYNNTFNETVLILAERNIITPKYADENIIFKVQLTMIWDKLSLNDTIFSAFPATSLDYYFDEGYYKYTLGNEKSENDCISLLRLAQKNGFDDAFIAAFKNGKRISLSEANLLK